MVEFQMYTSYHPPVGFQKRGHNEFYFVSRCGRWYVRQGNGGMVLTDRTTDQVHLVDGKMRAVAAWLEKFLAAGGLVPGGS